MPLWLPSPLLLLQEDITVPGIACNFVSINATDAKLYMYNASESRVTADASPCRRRRRRRRRRRCSLAVMNRSSRWQWQYSRWSSQISDFLWFSSWQEEKTSLVDNDDDDSERRRKLRRQHRYEDGDNKTKRSACCAPWPARCWWPKMS